MQKNQQDIDACSIKNYLREGRDVDIDYRRFERNLRSYLPLALLQSEELQLLQFPLDEKSSNNLATQSSSDDLYFEVQRATNLEEILMLVNTGGLLLKGQANSPPPPFIKLYPQCSQEQICLREQDILVLSVALSMQKVIASGEQSQQHRHQQHHKEKRLTEAEIERQNQIRKINIDFYDNPEINRTKTAKFIEENSAELLSKVQRLYSAVKTETSVCLQQSITVLYVCNSSRKYGWSFLEILEETLQRQVEMSFPGFQVKLVLLFAIAKDFQALQRLIGDEQLEVLQVQYFERQRPYTFAELCENRMRAKEQVLEQDTEKPQVQDQTTLKDAMNK